VSNSSNFFATINHGGAVVYILVLCSVISITIIVERVLYYFRLSKVKRPQFMSAIRNHIDKKDVKKAVALCDHTSAPFAKVVKAGLLLQGRNERLVSQSMEREIVVETIKLERFISVSATIGSTAIYIGLLGTVLGIMRAFHDISINGVGGINVIIGGISQSLIATAAGLMVALPALISYNYFVRRIDLFVVDMELSSSELIDILDG
jgi:biopolymer transport protein ExbB